MNIKIPSLAATALLAAGAFVVQPPQLSSAPPIKDYYQQILTLDAAGNSGAISLPAEITSSHSAFTYVAVGATTSMPRLHLVIAPDRHAVAVFDGSPGSDVALDIAATR